MGCWQKICNFFSAVEKYFNWYKIEKGGKGIGSLLLGAAAIMALWNTDKVLEKATKIDDKASQITIQLNKSENLSSELLQQGINQYIYFLKNMLMNLLSSSLYNPMKNDLNVSEVKAILTSQNIIPFDVKSEAFTDICVQNDNIDKIQLHPYLKSSEIDDIAQNIVHAKSIQKKREILRDSIQIEAPKVCSKK